MKRWSVGSSPQMTHKTLSLFLVGWSLLNAAPPANARPLPLKEDAWRLLRSASVLQPELRMFIQPQFEEAFLNINPIGDGARAERIRQYQRRFKEPNRGAVSVKTKQADLFADIGLQTDALVRDGDGGEKRLAVLSLRALAGADFQNGWTAAFEIDSRIERGDADISPYLHENDTGRYASSRTPNVLRSDLSWRRGAFRLTIGRQEANWGPGLRHGLILSKNAGPAPTLKGEALIGKARFTALIASLIGPETEGGSRAPKYLAAHRVEFSPAPWLTAAVSESVVWINQFDLKYLNPLDIFYLDTEPVHPDNRNLGIELSVFPARNLQLYAEALIDDFQPQEGASAFKSWGTKGGARIGAFWTEPFQLKNADVWAETLFINQYAYTHKRAGAEYAHRGLHLGHPAGPDVLETAVRASYWWTARVKSEAEWTRARKGEGSLLKPHDPKGPSEWGSAGKLLSGVIETANRWTAALEYSAVEGFFARLAFSGVHRQNADHTPQKRAYSTQARLVLGYNN